MVNEHKKNNWSLKGKFLILPQYCSCFQPFMCIWTLDCNSNFHVSWISPLKEKRKSKCAMLWLHYTNLDNTNWKADYKQDELCISGSCRSSKQASLLVCSLRPVGMSTENKANLWVIKESEPFCFFSFQPNLF